MSLAAFAKIAKALKMTEREILFIVTNEAQGEQ